MVFSSHPGAVHTVYLSNKVRGGMLDDQYTTTKGCSSGYSLSRGILAIYHKPEVPYCYYKLVTNLIRVAEIYFLSHLSPSLCAPECHQTHLYSTTSLITFPIYVTPLGSFPRRYCFCSSVMSVCCLCSLFLYLCLFIKIKSKFICHMRRIQQV
jgi:hypothetical protein